MGFIMNENCNEVVFYQITDHLGSVPCGEGTEAVARSAQDMPRCGVEHFPKLFTVQEFKGFA